MGVDKRNAFIQKEHIATLQQETKKDTQKAAMEINAKYEKYVNGDDNILKDILDALDKKNQARVISQLKKVGCLDEENVNTAMQEARLAVWQFMQKSRENQEVTPAFSNICGGIYYHKVMDVVRSVLTSRRHFGGGMDSLDREFSEGNGTMGSMIPDKKYKMDGLGTVVEEKEKKNLFKNMFKMYCVALTNSDAEPPRGLALYYSRILPHVLNIWLGSETIPEGKVASPKWAREQMGRSTIGGLSIESEVQMKKYISEKLCWCDAHRKQLETCMTTKAGTQVMKNVIFTEEFDEKKVGHMTDYMHKIIAKDWLQMMKKDAKLLKDAIEYTEEMDKLRGMLRGGNSR